MKHLRFDELILLSRPERAARRIPFHPRSTVLKGRNSTGKSSVLKSLYATIGAEPPIIHDKWKDAQVVSSLKFHVDAAAYRMIRNGSRFSLFDANDRILGSYTSVTTDLAPAIAKLMSFNLLLRSTSGGLETQATPAFLYLPFYIDQDVGWTDTLNSFARLGQFKSPKVDVFAFHFGIRPSEFYAAKSRLTEADAQAEPFKQERTTLERVLAQLEAELQVADFGMDLDVFREEVQRLLERGNELRQEEEQLRLRMNETYAVLATITDQIEITKVALKELRADREFAAELQGESVRCPTCHAEYANGFAERFSIAVDEDGCIALLGQLDGERRRAQENYDEARQDTLRARQLASEIEQLLVVRRGKLVLQDMVRSESRREMRRVVAKRTAAIDIELTSLAGIREAARAEMRRFSNRDRTKQIREYFRGQMTRLLLRLDVLSLPPSSLKRPESKVRETGSNLTRALLAHYFASIRTIARYSTCAVCPLVIDTPKQQDPDESRWTRIRQVINEERPDGSQLILALADDGGTDFGGRTIELADEYSILRRDQYSDAAAEVMPLVEQSLRTEAT